MLCRVVKPILDSLRDPVALDVGSGNSLDPGSGILVRVHDRGIGRPSGRMPLAIAVFLQPTLDLVVKTVSENERTVRAGRPRVRNSRGQ